MSWLVLIAVTLGCIYFLWVGIKDMQKFLDEDNKERSPELTKYLGKREPKYRYGYHATYFGLFLFIVALIGWLKKLS